MTIDVFYRPAESGSDTPFYLVVSTQTMPGASDELASWNGPGLSHGDLVRVVGETHDRLFVFDDDVKAFKRVPKPLSIGFYEEYNEAAKIFRQCSKVDERKRALVAVDCAALALKTTGVYDREITVALGVKRAWALGRIPVERSRCSIAGAVMRYTGGDTKSRAVRAAIDAVRGDYSDSVDNAVLAVRIREGLIDAMADIVRRHIPISVAACAALTMRDPLPMSKEARSNPFRLSPATRRVVGDRVFVKSEHGTFAVGRVDSRAGIAASRRHITPRMNPGGYAPEEVKWSTWTGLSNQLVKALDKYSKEGLSVFQVLPTQLRQETDGKSYYINTVVFFRHQPYLSGGVPR